MIRRLLSACVGAALLYVLTAPVYIAAKAPDLPEDGTFTATSIQSPPAPLFRLRPMVRRTFAGSLLFGIHPVLGFLPTDRILDAPGDHPHLAGEDDVLRNAPPPDPWKISVRRHQTDEDVLNDLPHDPEGPTGTFGGRFAIFDPSHGDWWKWHISHWIARQQLPTPEQNEGYVQPVVTGMDFAYRVVQEPPASEDETPAPVIEVLPMPHEESDVTCPYLRQQMIDRHACQIADPDIGRDVLANLECLKEADNLVELARELARYGFVTEAMMCCDLATNRCPGSPCAARAVDTLNELAVGNIPPTTDTEESAEPQPDEPTEPASQDAEPGVEPMVFDLMKACHLLMNQGMQHQAAELARQAFALDPQRVLADPLVYKMHLLAESPPTPAGSSEESEPQTCPYCPSIAKPIREIVPEKKKSKDGPTTFLVPSLPPIDYEVVPALDGELRLSAECAVGDNVYHLRYKHGSLAVWTTMDASKTKP